MEAAVLHKAFWVSFKGICCPDNHRDPSAIYLLVSAVCCEVLSLVLPVLLLPCAGTTLWSGHSHPRGSMGCAHTRVLLCVCSGSHKSCVLCGHQWVCYCWMLTGGRVDKDSHPEVVSLVLKIFLSSSPRYMPCIHSLTRFFQVPSPTGADICKLPTNREVLSEWPQRYTGKVPSNHFTLNDNQDCAKAARWLREHIVSAEGECLHWHSHTHSSVCWAHCFLNSMLQLVLG